MIENSTALTMDCLTSIMLEAIIYIQGQAMNLPLNGILIIYNENINVTSLKETTRLDIKTIFRMVTFIVSSQVCVLSDNDVIKWDTLATTFMYSSFYNRLLMIV